MEQIVDFFRRFFQVESWPPRWNCGIWSEFHGWLYILSDIVIWLSYFAIPVIILIYLSKRKVILFPGILLLSAAFILACGFTHLIDAIIFWHPIYRVAAVARMLTAAVSVTTVFALIKVLPVALSLKSPQELQAEVLKRKHAEYQLASSEERFSLAMKGTNDGIWDWPDVTDDRIWWSPRLYELLGYQDREIPSSLKVFYKIIHPDDREEMQRALDNNLEKGIPFDVEYRLLNKAGHYKWFRGRADVTQYEADRPVRMTGSISDIDDKKRMEEELRKLNITLERKVEDRTRELEKTKELYEDLYNNAPTMYISISADNEEVVECNSTYLKKTGFSKEEVVGCSAYCICHEDSLEKARKTFEQFRREGVVKNEELQLRKKNGDRIDVLMNASAARDKHGKIIKSRSSFQDISSLKEAEQKIMELNNKLNKQVVELKRVNDELEAFSYSVSHDLRSPLRAINGYAFTIEEEATELGEEGRNMLSKIRRNSERMGHLIDDLLQFSQMSRKKTKFGTFSMQNLVDQVIGELLDSSTGKKVEIKIGDLPDAYGDHMMIRQVVFNLLSNAIKYSSLEEKPVIEVGSIKEKNSPVYFVKDNGVGFDMRYKHKLFGVFERLHEGTEFEGTGIGLAIVKRVVDRHDGGVWAESKVNEGAIFYFSIQANNKKAHEKVTE